MIQNYNQFLSTTASSFVYQWEMYPKAQCNVNPENKVAFVSDNSILVGMKGSSGVSFKLQDCKKSGTK
jgi:hypothetical protein